MWIPSYPLSSPSDPGGANIDARPTLSDIDARLFEAAKKGDVREIEAAIKRGASLKALAGDRTNVLHAAARWGRADACAFLAKRGVPINDVRSGLAPLDMAVYAVSPDTVRTLLEFGARVSTDDSTWPVSRSLTMLFRSTGMGSPSALTDIFEMLTDRLLEERSVQPPSSSSSSSSSKGVDGEDRSGMTLLDLAVQGGATYAIAPLIELGIDPDRPGRGGNTPLHRVCYCGESPSATRGLEELLKHVSQVDPINDLGETPLWATIGSGLAMARLLCAAGADLDLEFDGRRYEDLCEPWPEFAALIRSERIYRMIGAMTFQAQTSARP
jgi:ankyrin repeat protein